MRFGFQFVVPLDAHHGKDDDDRGFFRRIAAAEAHNSPLVGEFDNGAHLAARRWSAAYRPRMP